MIATLITLICAACVAALLVVDQRADPSTTPILKWVLKPAASAAFIGLALYCGAMDTEYGRLILVGLALCMAGDIFLIAKAQAAFLAGMGAFALGHAAYIGAFLTIGSATNWVDVISLLVVLVLVRRIFLWLCPHLGTFRRPVAIYCAIISLMIVASLATQNPDGGSPYWMAAFGAVGFAISDISVARDQFVRQEFFNRLWGLPLYYAAQIVLAASVSL